MNIQIVFSTKFQGGDSVMECVHENVGTNLIKAYMSWNVPGQKNNKRLTVPILDSRYSNSLFLAFIIF